MEMGDNYSGYSDQQAFVDIGSRIRDMEEKQRILKDRLLLVGKSLIDERDKNFSEIQEMKKIIIKITEENIRMREFIQRMAEQLEKTARKEELMILQRQIDLFRSKN